MRKKIFYLCLFLILLLVVVALVFYKKYYPGLKPVITDSPTPIEDFYDEEDEETIYEEQTLENDRPLKLPSQFDISIFAKDLPNSRVLILDPVGNMLLSQTKSGTISHLTVENNKVTSQKTLLSGLNNPHGLAFYDDQLYVAEEQQVSVYEYDPTTATAANPKKIIDLPQGNGSRNHFSRSIGFGPDERLYVATGSSCNVCEESDTTRAKILSMEPDGSDVKEFATGLRNAVFFKWSFVDGRMWATEMGRDGLGNDTPPDEINILEEGNFYGWPYYYGKDIRDLTFEPNSDLSFTKPLTESYIDLKAHSAPLGLDFIPEEGWPEDYWYDLLVAYHGSWNSTVPTGYKVVRIKLDAEGNYEGTEDFITGWLTANNEAFGRPVDILTQPGGQAYITDDKAGVIYKVTLLEQSQ